MSHRGRIPDGSPAWSRTLLSECSLSFASVAVMIKVCMVVKRWSIVRNIGVMQGYLPTNLTYDVAGRRVCLQLAACRKQGCMRKTRPLFYYRPLLAPAISACFLARCDRRHAHRSAKKERRRRSVCAPPSPTSAHFRRPFCGVRRNVCVFVAHAVPSELTQKRSSFVIHSFKHTLHTLHTHYTPSSTAHGLLVPELVHGHKRHLQRREVAEENWDEARRHQSQTDELQQR